MALRRENYTLMGLCILVYVISILSLSAQDQACPIWADLEPIADQRTATPTIYSQSMSIPFYDWEQLDSSRYSDDQYATLDLPGYKRSEMAVFSRWGHKIPDGATIHGIKLAIEGHQRGSGNIRDVKVQLQGSNENRAGQYLGVAFPDSIDQVWRYGGADDTWGRNWSADQINSSSFGLIYQVRNSLSGGASLHIDQITIEIFFTPMYTFCNDEHACIAFGVEEVPGYSYNWNIPLGFTRLSSLNEQHTVNIGADETTNYGQYNLCIDIYDENGNFAEYCCRKFRYENCNPAYIGNQVFLDNNHDNIFSIGDEGVTEVDVFLYDEFDNLIAQTSTDDEDGMYQFEVEEGNYYVGIALPDGTVPIVPNVGADNSDSDLTNANGPLTTDTFFAGAGTNIHNIDIGLARELIIGDRVWEDKDFNGIQDSLEMGLADIEVALVSTSGDTLMSTTTDNAGVYRFDGIRVDDYELVFNSEGIYWPTQQGLGSEDLNSDIDNNGSTGIIDFDALDMPYLGIDAGYYRFASVGNYVFFDNNENGIQDALDGPLDSITVTLSTASGMHLETLLTDESGTYLFDSLTPGQYIITAEGPEIFKPTLLQQGSNPTIDNDLDNVNGVYTTNAFMLMSNESNIDIDLGWENNLADLGGLVFEDVKYNGQYASAADSLITNAMVSLLAMDGTLIETQNTDVNGKYLFTNVLPGSYYIKFEVGSEYLFTKANFGDDATDSDVTSSIENGSTDIMLVTVGMDSLEIDAGIYRFASIGDYVFLDINEDGIQNNDDLGLSGIELALIDATGSQVALDTSGVDGTYLFDDLVPGEYTITLLNSDLYLPTITGEGTPSTDSDLLESNGQYFSDLIATCSGQQMNTIDFGFVIDYATITGQVYEDSKTDAIFNVGDTAIVNVTVTLYDALNQVVQSTITDDLGNFRFENIIAGDFYIQYGLSNEYLYSTANITAANGAGSTDTFTLVPGETKDDELTGAYILGSIGDYVFLDLDEDGIQGDTDQGLAEIFLELFDINGNLVSSATSDESGAYVFDGLTPGQYFIFVTASDLYLATLPYVGDENMDSDLLFGSGLLGTSFITICSGQNDNSIDLGFVNNYAQITGSLFEDSKANGILDTPDTMKSGVKVDLYNANDELIQSTNTTSDGIYSFEDVLAGNYYILYNLSSDYIFSTADVTGANGVGSTDEFTLLPGESVANDATGVYRTGSIGDYIFLDLNEDGIQDDMDQGLAEIFLELFDINGNLVSSAMSDESGAYVFDGLTPGQYFIFVTASDLYLATLPYVGDENMDSDLLFGSGLLGTSFIAICSGQNDNSIDLGFVNNYAQITGSLFEDSKANGILDTPDTMKSGVKVDLYNTNDELIQSTNTASDGMYSFEDVLAGNYYILYNLSSDYIFSTADVTGANGVGSTDEFTLLPGESVANDATGAYLNASIGDYVFFDQDDNGLQSVADIALSDIQLTLYNDLGVDQGMITTDANGAYVFDNVTPGKYIIQAQFEDLYLPTGYHQGDENLDSDLQNINGVYVSDTISICSGQMFDNIDFGLANNYAEIGGVVFTDMMRNGQLMTIDELLIGIPVVLFDASNMEVASTVTDANGAYIFNNIIAGDYYVVFDLGDRLVTLSDVGEDATDSDVTETNGVGSTDIIILSPGGSNLTIFAGVYELSSIGDFVWSDDNRNGLQDASEVGITDVVVNLYDDASVLIGKDTTDINGIYGFGGLTPGIFYIEVEYPQDLTATINTLSDLTLNSDLVGVNGEGTSDLITLLSGTNNLDIDAGLGLAGAEIHGEVWLDIDGDEMQSVADTLLPNIPVKLYNVDTGVEVFSTVTDQDGTYTFKSIDEGNYYVQFQIAETLLYVTEGLGDEAIDSDVDDTNGIGTTGTISVVIGDVIRDVDAGVEYGKSSISGLVWIDKNGDGINDATEVNLDTYAVNLHITDGTIIKTVMAKMDGTYSIDDIASGDYYITFSGLVDYVFTAAEATGDDTIDSDVTESQEVGSTDVIILGIQDAQVYDAGVYQLGSIGDFVWFDTNSNGLQDAGEPGVEFANLTILNLASEAVDIVNTAEDGAYLFDGLAPGGYWIFMQAPLGLKATTYQTGTDSELDSDLFTDGEFLLSDTIMIMSGQNVLSVDFGFVENTGSIEGFVWNDIDVDGIFNDASSTFDAVTVELYSTDDNMLVATTATDADGGYFFNSVMPNDYYIKFVPNDNSTFTAADQGIDDDVDSDVTGANGDGNTDTFTLNPGQTIINVFAGLIFPAKIGNLAFLDQNSNGLQDADEPGIPSIIVILYDENGVKLDSVITDLQGLYSFIDLDPSNYYIEFVYPDSIQPTIVLPMMPILNSDITETNGTGTTDMVFLGSGVCNEDIDGGFVPSGGVIIGEVWLDADGNDIQDNPSIPVEGIEVTLYKTNNTTFAGPVLTNELGIYGFSSIPTGSYYVGFDIPDTLDFVNPNVGPADTDSDVTGLMGEGSTAPFIVVDGELFDNVDAGVIDIRSIIQGQLFIDSDGDGVKDADNQGLAGVDVTLFDVSGSQVSSTITSASGSYIFEGLLANFYYIEFYNYPSTYLFTESNVGVDDTVDSDIVVTNNGVGLSSSVLVSLNQVVSIDGGVYELASVGDYAWIDENNDGIQHPSELPLMGILVEVIDADQNVLGSSTTDDSGMYLIEDLVPGTYNLIFSGVDNYIPTIANLGSDDTLDSDINTINSQQAATGTFDLLSGENNEDFDAGYIFAQLSDGVISGLAWTDSDGNGIREASNPGIPDIGVLLFNDLNVEQASTITNEDGEYSFTELAGGNYYIVFQNEIGTSPTIPNVGSDLTDSDITAGNGDSSTDIINLGLSEVIENVDGGFVAVGAIGNQIFVDINGNGRKGNNEPGLNGVTVKLYSSTGTLLQTTISISDISTMNDGYYQFNDVELGSYYLVFELPEPYLFTDPNKGTIEGLDSDVTALTNGPGSTDTFSLASGEVRDDIDAGAFLPAQIGDFVWDDLNADGIQNDDEPGIPNITVEIKRSNGLSLAVTSTDASGNYCFDGLKQGLYYLEFEFPTGFVVSDINQGNDNSLDSDIDATGTTPLISMVHGSTFKEVDAGFHSQTNNNLISHVWFDENINGTYEEGELTIEDVAISLLDDQGTIIAQTITNFAGKYAFINIPIGDYQVSVGLDDGLATTMMNEGNDDWIDSDVDVNGMSAMFTVNNGLSIPNVDIGLIEDDGFIPEIVFEAELLSEKVITNNEFDQKQSPITFVSGPNPFYNRVQVRMSRLVDGVAYTIYRLDGALVQSGVIIEKDQWIVLEQHNDGMYILVLTHNDKPVDKQYLMKVN